MKLDFRADAEPFDDREVFARITDIVRHAPGTRIEAVQLTAAQAEHLRSTVVNRDRIGATWLDTPWGRVELEVE